MKKKLTIGQCMTPFPRGIEPHLDLEQARKRMEELGVHHLPVQSGGRLIGILSERDIQFVAAHKDLGPTWKRVTVEEAMTPEPYQVSADTPLWKVAQEMAEHRYGCALVTDDNNHLQGLFTYTDAMTLLAELTSK